MLAKDVNKDEPMKIKGVFKVHHVQTQETGVLGPNAGNKQEGSP